MIPRYRAWDKIRKTMYEDEDIIAMSFEDKSICIQTIYFGHGLPDSFEQGLPDSRDLDYYDFDDIVLMQSTGLTDYNGREIFEGDIVKMSMNFYSNPTYYEVVRSIGGTYRLESSQHGCELWLRHADCYIVGNIYENTELLEELK
ncbi:YopX family protein [Streptococcus thermophilus]|uniref:YopX protein domain-containing protein n=2 Tax=root TaxID=1 RepID=W6LLF9_9CAUD|nr:YopX family protein [Streptococcus thermophilus]YP_009003370.1 YopX family protein [Streptococcus phage 20617]MDA3672866.1 YopX family protein [Streptococcus thermophilus]MDA5412767.1 YopX family protein [Streptococcus thermophilus]TDG54751.1 hypothetical protein C4K59_000482 [Streptococcus thermophilus]UEC18251.1 YopX family protein [Streptococcus thermophilus LMD-9]UEC18292.1 YopX family protein [Streptococcus thermophilus LMD-9]